MCLFIRIVRWNEFRYSEEPADQIVTIYMVMRCVYVSRVGLGGWSFSFSSPAPFHCNISILSSSLKMIIILRQAI